MGAQSCEGGAPPRLRGRCQRGLNRSSGCLYLKTLEGVHLTVLEGLVRTAIERVRAKAVTG